MSLTKGGGPLGRATGHTNYSVDAPAHRLLFEPDARRLRAYVGDHLGPMVESTVTHHVPQRADRAGLDVVRAEHEPVEA